MRLWAVHYRFNIAIQNVLPKTELLIDDSKGLINLKLFEKFLSYFGDRIISLCLKYGINQKQKLIDRLVMKFCGNINKVVLYNDPSIDLEQNIEWWKNIHTLELKYCAPKIRFIQKLKALKVLKINAFIINNIVLNSQSIESLELTTPHLVRNDDLPLFPNLKKVKLNSFTHPDLQPIENFPNAEIFTMVYWEKPNQSIQHISNMKQLKELHLHFFCSMEENEIESLLKTLPTTLNLLQLNFLEY